MIETSRLRLEPFAERHISARYVSWLNDPEVVRLSDQRFRTHTLESCRDYLRSFEGTPHNFWAIVAKDESLGHVGNLNAYVDVHHGVADMGILIGERSVWGRGYGYEAWSAAMAFLLARPDVRKVAAGTTTLNHGMLGVMRRAGMVDDGIRRRHAVVDGVEADVVHMAVFK
jgi:ribosomal-protein-alanine N-acetyltransferase